MSTDPIAQLYELIMLKDMEDKCRLVKEFAEQVNKQANDKDLGKIHTLLAPGPDTHSEHNSEHKSAALDIPIPGLPTNLLLDEPRKLKRRGISKQEGRNTLMHAIAHIEFNAINLALDAAYRFRQQPLQYYCDWINIAADEARHFCLVREYLLENDCDYGDLPAHNGLWDMAVQTANDIVARMALVPRVMEARGLDVTPTMINRLNSVGDGKAVSILETIYQDEIAHVRTGSEWFFYQCSQRQLEPRDTFKRMVETHLHGELKGPFNIPARLQAGFDEQELTSMNQGFS